MPLTAVHAMVHTYQLGERAEIPAPHRLAIAFKQKSPSEPNKKKDEYILYKKFEINLSAGTPVLLGPADKLVPTICMLSSFR